MNDLKVHTDFQTPVPVCEYMADMVPRSARNILEPTPGIGNLVRALEDKLIYTVTAPTDFFLLDPDLKFDCVVMNPPFSSKSGILDNAPEEVNTKGMKLGYYLLQQCMQRSDNIIALMPWFTLLDSDVRMRELETFGIRSLTSLPRKTFKYARIQTVIIELQKGCLDTTIFQTFNF